MGPEGERQDEGCQRSADERPGAVTSPAGIGAVAEAANEGGVPQAGEEHQQGHRRFDDVGLVGHALVRHQADAARAHDHGGLARMGPALVGGVGAHRQRQRIGQRIGRLFQAFLAAYRDNCQERWTLQIGWTS